MIQPDDVFELPSVTGDVITGLNGEVLPFSTVQIDSLRAMLKGGTAISPSECDGITRPTCAIYALDPAAAMLARVVAAGEHSLLLAGPPGSGKSTLASVLPSLVEAPSAEHIREVRHFWNARNERLTWRPVLKPHHTITPLAMIGGGSSLWPGEITRAHNGILIMDELLEFHSEIQESLREPVENGSISIVRGGRSRMFPARVLLIGTTNLCKCGKFVPRRNFTCRCSRADRKRILTRLTGPFVDRFAVVALTDQWSDDGEIAVETVAKEVASAIEFRRARGQSVPNARLLPEVIEATLTKFEREQLVKTSARSRRRKTALLQVARTLADLRQSEKISISDLERSRELTVQTHRTLEEFND